MNLEEFFNYKTELMKTICSSSTLVNLITDEDTTAPNRSLMYKNVFPFEYVPDTATEGNTYICFDVDVTDVEDNAYLSAVLYIWPFTHKSKLRLPNGRGVRLDMMCSEIDKLINRSRVFGLGELKLRQVTRFIPADDFYGRAMAYELADFNMPKTRQAAPANRRLGQ